MRVKFIINLLYIGSAMFSLALCGSLHAQQFDQAYLKWKAKQEQIDAQLKSNDSNYYLSRPQVNHSSSANTSGKAIGTSKAKMLSATDKVRINSANIAELQQLNGVGEKKAQLIIEYRDQHGKFKTIDELQEVKGIGPKLIEKNRSRLSL